MTAELMLKLRRTLLYLAIFISFPLSHAIAGSAVIPGLNMVEQCFFLPAFESSEILPKYDLRKTYHLRVNLKKPALEGRGQWQLTGYAASDLRSGMADVISEGESSDLYFDREFASLNIDSIQMINPGISTLPVMVNFRMYSEDAVQLADTEMVVQPFLMKDFNHNPFMGESRILDEEFDFPYRVKQKVYVSIPEGYEVWGLPNNEQLNVRKQNALLKLDVVEQVDKVLLIFDFSIGEPVFKKKDQDVLKAIFDKYQAIAKSAIILRKSRKVSSTAEK